jgi:predicted  nucleic acid-binding Zn-ribbon protein
MAINDLQNRNLTLREDIYAINQRIAVEQNASARAALLNQADRLRYQMEGYNQEIGRLQIRLAQAEAQFAPLNR